MRKKVLIVDDEEDITWSIARGLIKDSKTLEILCANNGSAALDILSKNRIHLLITDIRMPGVNGRQLFEQVKQLYSGMGIIVMTAYESREIDEWFPCNDVISYIEKPFEISDLRKRILSFVNKNKSGSTGSY